jgi:uncharacterized protein YsxB (DUF464 family)
MNVMYALQLSVYAILTTLLIKKKYKHKIIKPPYFEFHITNLLQRIDLLTVQYLFCNSLTFKKRICMEYKTKIKMEVL